MKELVLALLKANTISLLDLLRLKTYFKEYMREVANKLNIDTTKGGWSVQLSERSPLVKGVWAALDLAREYAEITATNDIVWSAVFNETEAEAVKMFIEKAEASEDMAKKAPTFDEILGA